MWDFFFCLLPVLVTIFFQWNWTRHLAGATVQHLGQYLWIMACRLLKLPTVTVPTGESQAEVRLICKPTALANHLKKHCCTLAQHPLTRWPYVDPHLQIIFNLLWPTVEEAEHQGGVCFTRDNLLLQDGGIVALDWAVNLIGQKAHAKRDHHPGERVLGHSSNPAILLMIPNALGRVTPHLLSLCLQALQQGFCPVVFHRRGHGGCPLTTPHYQEFGNPSDLVQAVAYLRCHHPSSTLLAVSEGSGSGLLLSYLGECGSSSYLTAAACISPVFHGQLWFEHELPWLYHWIFLIYRKLQINRYATALSSVMDVAKILHCTSLREMEELMFCATTSDSVDHVGKDGSRLSFKADWTSYWERNEPLRDADEVSVPVLCLCSRDDPLLPALSTVPEALFHNSPYFLLAVTEHGGHCGFLHEDGRGGPTSWSHSAVLEYFRVTTDFFRAEKKEGFKDVVAHGGSQGLRHSASAVLSRRRRSTLLRKERPILGSRRRQISTPSDTFTFEEEQVDFTWKRSYTR